MDETLKFVRSYNDKQVYLLSAPSLDCIPSHLGPPGPHFCLLLALDARGASEDALSTLARSVLSQGVVYVCAWGPECKKVELQFDYACVDLHLQTTVESVILTTSHPEESLKDVVEFFLETADPAADYKFNTRTWLPVAVGSAPWAKEIEELILSARSSDDLE